MEISTPAHTADNILVSHWNQYTHLNFTVLYQTSKFFISPRANSKVFAHQTLLYILLPRYVLDCGISLWTTCPRNACLSMKCTQMIFNPFWTCSKIVSCVFQRDCGISSFLLLGDLPKPTGHGPGHPALAVPNGAGVGPGGPGRPSAIWWSCNPLCDDSLTNISYLMLPSSTPKLPLGLISHDEREFLPWRQNPAYENISNRTQNEKKINRKSTS